jgi:non-heme chloroperoxidase
MTHSVDRPEARSAPGVEGVAMASTTVLFVHGLWLHADSWQPWVERFGEAGYDASAPGWPGDAATVEEARGRPETVAGYGIDDIVRHYADAAAGLAAKPIAVGHSFGGLVVQRLLGEGAVAAAVAIDPAPMKGVRSLPLSALRVASVALRSPANRGRAVSLSREQFRYGFGNALSAEESDALFERWTIPSPGKPLFEAALANFVPHSPAAVNTGNAARGPLLVTSGGRDHTVPPAISKATVARYRGSSATTELREFPDRGHSLTVDAGWPAVADAVLGWLAERGLGG